MLKPQNRAKKQSLFLRTFSLPVTKAFCNCPLKPVFHGPILFTALFRQKNITPIIISIATKAATPITTYNQTSLNPFCFSSNFLGGSESVLLSFSAIGGGDVNGGILFFAVATAGKEPLLRGNTLVVISGEGLGALGAGIASKLLVPSSNSRLLKILVSFSNEPATKKLNFKFYLCFSSISCFSYLLVLLG